ncbi:MAG: cupin [Planctomycetaceae bacterium]|nr:cupin [Planctomycetaceae bacterium]
MPMLRTRLDPTNTDSVEMDGVKDVSMRVLLGREHGMPHFSMRHFVVEPDGHTPHHSHDYEHQVIVLAGRGEAEQAGEIQSIEPGDVLFVEAGAEHQFRNTGEAPMQFVCLVPRQRDGGGEVPGS